MHRKLKKEWWLSSKKWVESLYNWWRSEYHHAYHLHFSSCQNTLASGKKWKSRKRNLFFHPHKEKLSVMLQGILNLIQSSYNLEASIKLKKLLGIESPNVDIQGGKTGNNTLAVFLPLFFSFLYLFPHDFFFIFIFELGKLALRWMKKCYHGFFLVVLIDL